MLAALSAVTIFAFVACSKGGGNLPTSSNDAPVTPAAGTGKVAAAQPTTGVCAGKPTWAPQLPNGKADLRLQMCDLESTLELHDNRCQIVPAGGGSWTHKIGIVSETPGYFISRVFHGPENSCGSTGEGGTDGAYQGKTFPAGESTYTFSYTKGDGCGMDQDDIDAKNATSQASARAVVFNYPTACPTCAALKTKLNEKKTGTRSMEVGPTWNGGGTATLNWGDGTPAITGVRSGESYSHTYAGNGPYTIDLVVKQGGLECPDPVTVKFDPDPNPTPKPTPSPKTCRDYEAPTITGNPRAAATTTAVNVDAGTVAPTGGSFNPLVPFSVNRPDYGQSAASWNTRYTLRYGPENLECAVIKDFSGTVPPKEGTCEQRNSDYGSVDGSGSKTVTGTSPHMTLVVASSWSVAAGRAQTLTFEIVYNITTSNFVKKSKTVSYDCSQGGQGSLTWGPGDTYNSSPNYSSGDGHIKGTFTLRVKRGSTVVGTFPLP